MPEPCAIFKELKCYEKDIMGTGMKEVCIRQGRRPRVTGGQLALAHDLQQVMTAAEKEAATRFQRGVGLFKDGDFDGNGKADSYGLSNLGMLPIFGAFGPIPYTNNAGAGRR